MSTKFELELGQEVNLKLSGEHGIVIGRAEYLNTSPMYQIMYKAGDGRQVTEWWYFDQLELR